MGSSQPPNGRLPFGYLSEDPISEAPTFDVLPGPPPEPAPGNPILTTAETNGLASMLAAMTSNAYGEHNFGEGITGDDWMMPPSLMGTATSFGLQPHMPVPDGLYNNTYYQPTTPQSFAAPDSLLAPAASTTTTTDTYTTAAHPRSNAAPLISAPHTYNTIGVPLASPVHQHPIDHQTPSADVLEAANSLMRGGSHGRSQSLQHEPTFSNGPQKASAMGPPVGHLRHQQWSEFRQEERRMSHSHSNHASEQEAVLATWMYGPNAQANQRHNAPPPPIDLQYGTDHNFNKNQPFVPPNDKESTDAIHQDQLRYLNAIRLSNSAETTRPPSPVFNGEEPPYNVKSRAPPPPPPPIKTAVSKASARKRKSKGEIANSPGAEGAGSGKRRKSSAAVKRENLTEDQKRENHINSEKKRRKVIQVGFENLSHIVPAIKGGNPSKSAMLEATVAWLQDLLDGNEALKAQASQI
ncbi:hypothetical protein VPNG_01190 [Cytospora leucostoma]|uniref:BHLH domain-containing protein n=1 Tax=Cytospora leucostoma TaxID=1230097 RepID=A0A423XLQ8_9PEZI|nr:hypothetical protein VPNG_01190 [Cytospora leucostoma]